MRTGKPTTTVSLERYRHQQVVSTGMLVYILLLLLLSQSVAAIACSEQLCLRTTTQCTKL
jgi:hypothetical protein